MVSLEKINLATCIVDACGFIYNIFICSLGGGPGDQRPELASTDLQLTFEVTLNDDPYGRFAFPAESREVSVAEDYLPGDEESTRVGLTVVRRQGAFTTVQVG